MPLRYQLTNETSQTSAQVTEFKGPGNETKAAKYLLRNNHRVGGVVVRGVCDVSGRDCLREAADELKETMSNHGERTEEIKAEDRFIQTAYDTLGLAPLDSFIKRWMILRRLYPKKNSRAERSSSAFPHIGSITSRSASIFPHTDTSCYGPVILSLRIDNSDEPRTFYLQPSGLTTVSRGGKRRDDTVDQALLNRLNDKYDARTLNEDMTTIEQAPGDLVIISNNPRPAIHAVRTEVELGERSVTQVLLLQYVLRQTERFANIR